MSSALHSPQPQPQQTKQLWWSRQPSSSKIPSVSTSYRSASSPGTPTTPSSASPSTNSMFDDKSLSRASGSSKQSRKFNSLASVIGFKSKKGHPTIDIPPGPASPPLPFQNPPSGPATAPPFENPPKRLGRGPRPITSSSYSSTQTDPRSPADPSIYTYPSSEEAYEPITPSDQLSRHRISYQPSLFTFAEQQERGTTLQFRDGNNSRYLPIDYRRVSVMSDPSILDPQLPREGGIRASHISSSSFYPPDPKVLPSRLLDQHYGGGRRESSSENRLSREVDLSQATDMNSTAHLTSSELRPRNSRFSDTNVPIVPNLSSFAMSSGGQGSPARVSPSMHSPLLRASGSRTTSRTGSPIHATYGEYGSYSGRHEEELSMRNRVASLRNSGAYGSNDFIPPQSARLSPGTQGTVAATGIASSRPKASSVSAGSGSNGSSQSLGARPSPTVVTSFSSTSLSRNVSSSSGSAPGNTVRRQISASRLRPVPPSRIPPPLSGLPPTPSEQTPSPMTFRSPASALEDEDILISPTSANDDPSIITFDLPPSTPLTSSSTESSSASLCFAQPYKDEQDILDDLEFESFAPMQRLRHEPHGSSASQASSVRSHGKSDFGHVNGSSRSMHGVKASTSSSITLMTALGIRQDTPVQRTIKKSMSQSSLHALTNAVRNERQRVDSEASIGSINDLSEEGTIPIFNSVRSLRKQRSMHNTRAAGGSLAMPPLPQQLRHANSFNTAQATPDVPASRHSKGDSGSSPFGSQRRKESGASPNVITTTTISVGTPTTPLTHKKRSLFSSHGRERRDSDLNHERRQESSGWADGERKKSSGLGLSMFSVSNAFSPTIPTSAGVMVNVSIHDSVMHEDDHFAQPNSPTAMPHSSSMVDQHILPPKELLSQMEQLADTNPPTPPSRFSLEHGIESETEEDECWDKMSYNENQSNRSRVTSTSGLSFADSDYALDIGFETASHKSNGTASASHSGGKHYFGNATASIHERLEDENANGRPSTGSSQVAPRKFSTTSRRSATRPSTADAYSTLGSGRDLTSERPMSTIFQATTALPPPPRKKGAAVSSIKSRSSTYDDAVSDAGARRILSPPPLPKANSVNSRLNRLPSFESSTSRNLHREPSRESLSTSASTYNPARGSIFKKPSFLNIDDDAVEQTSRGMSSMALSPSMISVPEDSFLILESGKDSLDLMRASFDLREGMI